MVETRIPRSLVGEQNTVFIIIYRYTKLMKDGETNDSFWGFLVYKVMFGFGSILFGANILEIIFTAAL